MLLPKTVFNLKGYTTVTKLVLAADRSHAVVLLLTIHCLLLLTLTYSVFVLGICFVKKCLEESTQRTP